MNNTATSPRLSNEEISRRGEELYARDLRAIIQTDENIGKILALDINTGAYEIDVYSLPAADRLCARVPDAIVYALRIGYDAVYALGGTLTRPGHAELPLHVQQTISTMTMNDYLALCDQAAAHTSEAFDSAADVRLMREERITALSGND